MKAPESMFGVDFCVCEDPYTEVIDGITFCEDCHGVLGYELPRTSEVNSDQELPRP